MTAASMKQPVSRADLKYQHDVDYVRAHMNEEIIFKGAWYLGEKIIINEKYGGLYPAHVWKVTYLKSNHEYLQNPQPGLLEIRSKDWDASDLDYEPDELTGTIHITFEGKVPVSIIFENESVSAGSLVEYM